MFEELGSGFHVSRTGAVLQVVCLRCGKFVAASARESMLRTAVAAHNCGSKGDHRHATGETGGRSS